MWGKVGGRRRPCTVPQVLWRQIQQYRSKPSFLLVYSAFPVSQVRQPTQLELRCPCSLCSAFNLLTCLPSMHFLLVWSSTDQSKSIKMYQAGARLLWFCVQMFPAAEPRAAVLCPPCEQALLGLPPRCRCCRLLCILYLCPLDSRHFPNRAPALVTFGSQWPALHLAQGRQQIFVRRLKGSCRGHIWFGRA